MVRPSRTRKRRLRVAFQGERGAFSEEAGRRILGDAIEPCPKREFDQMFESVIRDEADCAVVPIENTLAGSVIKNYDLLVENDLEIIGEVVLRVAHNLIAPKGTKLAAVRRIYSHPVALAQCEDTLRKLRANAPDLEVLPAYDTAGAVKMVVEIVATTRPPSPVASLPRPTARKSLPRASKATRRISRASSSWHGLTGANSFKLKRRSKMLKTSIVFRTTNKPGALFHALEAFAKGKIDLDQDRVAPHRGPAVGVLVLSGFPWRPQHAGRAPRAGQLDPRGRKPAHLRHLPARRVVDPSPSKP